MLKLKRKKKIIKIFTYSFLVGMLIINWNTILEPKAIQHNNEISYLDERTYLEISGMTDLTGTPIFIDDTDPSYNWSKTATENAWCTGAGTKSNPYVIDSVYINGLDSQACITVQNSDQYFVVNNSLFVNTGSSIYTDAGLHLINITNGALRNTTLSNHKNQGAELFNVNNTIVGESYFNNNTQYGIKLERCQNISIINNKIFENYKGLYTYFCNNITIAENEAYLNHFGFHIGADGNYLNIFENIFRDNLGVGISFSVHNSIFTGNNFLNNDMSCYSADNCTISNNDFVSSYLKLEDSSNNTICNNKVYNSTGIILSDLSRNNLIHQNELYNTNEGIYIIYHYADHYYTNNIISKNDIIDSRGLGINLYHACGNIIQDNNIINSKYYGIKIVDCENNTLKNNIIENSTYGISLQVSRNETFLNNTIRYNNIGFEMRNSRNIQILNNSISHNNETGIEIGSSTRLSVISENNISYNGHYGIYALDLDFSNITRNFINYNEIGICLNYSTYNNIIGNDLRGNSICIKEVNSNDNVFEDNICDTSELDLIQGYDIYLFLGGIFFLGLLTMFKIKYGRKKDFRKSMGSR